jgi:hypothetical protein
MTEYCTYCQIEHKMLDFGKDFAGNDVRICPDRQSDVLVKTMPKADYGELEDAEIE